MSKILFSIIVPVYNTERYLKKCIESIINQSYTNIEIILVNDGSEDLSPSICNEYSKKDPRIKVIHKRNGGLSDARNHGIKAATGDFILFVDSDDYIKDDACEKFNTAIVRYPNVQIVASNIECIHKDNKEMYTSTSDTSPLTGVDFLKTQLRNKTMYMSACRNLYDRRYLIENELMFKDGILHEDEQWTPRVFLNAKKVTSINYIHYMRVWREGSITRSKDKIQNALDLLTIIDELSELYLELDDYELKTLLYDYLVMLYLNAFYIGKMYKCEYRKYINKGFLVKNAKSLRNKIKVVLFCISPSMYYFINKLSKSIV